MNCFYHIVLANSAVNVFVDHFSDLSDLREEGNIIYPLADILVIAPSGRQSLGPRATRISFSTIRASTTRARETV
jgi:hypothetical protein